MGRAQLYRCAAPKAPNETGKVQLSMPVTAVPMGNTEMIAETGTVFELCTKQTSDPVLFQFETMRVDTFDKVLASAALARTNAVAITDAEAPNFPNISSPFKIGSVYPYPLLKALATSPHVDAHLRSRRRLYL